MISIQISGFIGFIILILDIWAIVNVIKSKSSVNMTVFWIILILILPLIGLILWLIYGPRAYMNGHNTRRW
ncbi:MAG: PLDc N-terminal domain-containing protein [Deferribacterota bacterium]|nr:PLDc N-terminal domain-containing protein [Deferribacterota bacterium]